MQITYEGWGFVDFTFRRWGRKVFHVHAYCSSPAKALQTSARRGSVTPTHIPTGGKDKCRYSQFKEAHTTEKKRLSLAFLGQHMWASRSTKDQPLVIQCYLIKAADSSVAVLSRSATFRINIWFWTKANSDKWRMSENKGNTCRAPRESWCRRVFTCARHSHMLMLCVCVRCHGMHSLCYRCNGHITPCCVSTRKTEAVELCS